MIENIDIFGSLHYLNPTITISILIKKINENGLVQYVTENKTLYKGSNCFCSDWWYIFCRDNALPLPEKPFTTCKYHDDCPWHPIVHKRKTLIKQNLEKTNLYPIEDPDLCPYSKYYDKRNATQPTYGFVVKNITASNDVYTFTNLKDETYVFGLFGYNIQQQEYIV